MQNSPKISVVVPTYERPEAVVSAIKTVQGQSFSDWEVIVVDDNHPGSEARESTKRLIKPYLNDKISYVEQTQNAGACAARNRGVSVARADIIAFLDDDDHWHPDKLRLQYSEFENTPGLALNICNIIEHYNGRVEHFKYDITGSDFFSYFLNRGAGVCCSAIAVRKVFFEQVGGFDIHQQSYQDLDLMLRMSRAFEASVLSEFLLFYQLADDGITKNPAKKVAGLKGIIEKFSVELKASQYSSAKENLYSALGDFLLLEGRCDEAASAYQKALSQGQSRLKVYTKFWLARLKMRFLFLWLLRLNHQRAVSRPANTDKAFE